MSRKAFWEVVTTLLLGLSLSAALQASIDRGVIQGTVTDPAGALVPGAKVVVKNVDTNVEVTLVTNAAGFYLAPELVPGRYTVRVESPGFVRLDVTNIVVTAGVTSQQDLTLRVGALTQSIEVTAAAPLVDSAPSNYTTSLQSRYIQDIPLQGRDIQTLVQLIPGVTQSTGPSGSLFGFDSQFGGFPDPQHLVGSGISANGGQGRTGRSLK